MADTQSLPAVAILGVGPGLGAALTHRFAGEYAVAINARRAEYLSSLGADIRAKGGQVLEVPADLGDRAQVETVFKTIREQLGSPEILLYNAGGSGVWGTIADITPEQYETSWRVNAYGAFLSAKEVAPDMIAKGHGTMLFTGATAVSKPVLGPSPLVQPSLPCVGWCSRWRVTWVPKACMWHGLMLTAGSTSQAETSPSSLKRTCSSPKPLLRPTGTWPIRTGALGQPSSKCGRLRRSSKPEQEEGLVRVLGHHSRGKDFLTSCRRSLARIFKEGWLTSPSLS